MKNSYTYFENLDGLRFFCFLSVFFYHSFYTEDLAIISSDLYQLVKFGIFGNGYLGVNFFFVLSGFLITYLLILEKNSFGRIHLPRFWIRRILRIWPLFYFCIFFGFILFPLLKRLMGGVPNESADIVFYLLFLNNFDLVKNWPDSSVLSVLWSVAVEEQFYLVWPIFLFRLPVRKYWLIFLSVIASSILFRIFHQEAIYLKYHTLSCIGDMAVGGFGAWLVQEKGFHESVKDWSISFIYVIYSSALIIFLFIDEITSYFPFIIPYKRLVISVIFLAIILEQTFASNSFFKMCRYRVITRLGRVTYGLYCLHFVGILITINLYPLFGFKDSIFHILIIETFTALLISIIIAKLSFRYYELPFLRLKEKFSSFRKF